MIHLPYSRLEYKPHIPVFVSYSEAQLNIFFSVICLVYITRTEKSQEGKGGTCTVLGFLFSDAMELD